MQWSWKFTVPLPTAGNIFGMRPANNIQCYIVMSSLIGRAHTQNYPCHCVHSTDWCLVKTFCGLDKMGAIFQTVFSNAFSLRKIWILIKVSLKFLAAQLTIYQHWLRWWLGTEQVTSHYLIQCWATSTVQYGITRPQWAECILPFCKKKKIWPEIWNLQLTGISGDFQKWSFDPGHQHTECIFENLHTHTLRRVYLHLKKNVFRNIC